MYFMEDLVQDLTVINIWITFKNSRSSNSKKIYKQNYQRISERNILKKNMKLSVHAPPRKFEQMKMKPDTATFRQWN